ncbi:bifunctional (p)ppGpp synthetase/guanosine-3',5'-bis(diphosphate) 3'-pyrophosphohydrolase, partial [bacterium]|nr:bifunctional (p)ppGpp synthetase/guanosine-3',5'-bis(diphosphate) 3'-pyrophosphohydrolase [bacterium]
MMVSNNYPKEFQQLIDNIASYNPGYLSETDLLYKAYNFAQNAHNGQFRRSGEPYFVHVYSTALILADLSMDPVTICAGLLHDVVEDTNISSEVIAQEFSELIADLVQGVTKIGGIKFYSRQQQQAENFHKMLLSVAKDIRVLIIKFADRLHNMRTLYSLPVVKQRRIAIETRDIYAPLASRLGMYSIKTEFEDLALKYLDSKMYHFLEKRILSRHKELETYIVKFTEHIKGSLDNYSIETDITGRLKHFYSIYRKMKNQNKQFEEIYDILAIRVIVKEVSECYAVLGLVHQEYAPIPHRFRDFIATPKTNGYQSVHTTVVGPDNRLIEVQIRTEKMHRTAEVGVAAHWKYKENRDGSNAGDLEAYVKWLRSLIEMLQKDVADDEEFFDTFKVDMFRDEIFVFTPKGDLVTLALGATALDFAFEVHSEVGVHCIGSKVNGKMVPINTTLSSGDRIEILTSNSSNISYNWVNFVKTSKAKT